MSFSAIDPTTFGSPSPLDTAASPLNQASLPAQIRNGSPADQKAYATALQFEQMLVQQLSQSMTDSLTSDGLGGSDSDGLGGDDSADGIDDSTDSSDSPYASLLPDALTQGIMGAGGLGIAQQLAPSLGATDLTEFSA